MPSLESRSVMVIRITCLSIWIVWLIVASSLVIAQTAKLPSTLEVQLPGYSVPVSGRWLGPSQNQSGIPLGGIGAGFVELRPDGLIHDSVLRNNWLKPAPIPGCGLTFAAKNESAALLSGVSASSGSLKPTPRYFGHFPIADLDFGRSTSTPISVWLRAYSPFEPQELDNSNIPVALFSVRVHNEDNKPHRVTLQFWWDNSAPPEGAAQSSGDQAQNSEFALGQIRGVRMARSSIPGTQAIAVNADGWFVEVAPKLAINGGLRARITATRILSPRDEKTAIFALAWHSAFWKAADGKRMVNRYAARYADARSVAENALNRAKEFETAIIGWQTRFYARGLPGWMKDALINGLYGLVRNSVWLDDGRLVLEDGGQGSDILESIPTRLNASYPLLLFFPEVELRTMKQYANLQKADGEIPVAVGVGAQEAIFGPQRQMVSSEFALLAYRDWLWTRDMAFLREITTAAKRALHFAMTLDTDNDGLINEPEGEAAAGQFSPYYGQWRWHGTSSYTAGIQLAALRAGEELGKASGDSEFTVWCKERHDKAASRFEADLWTGSYYRLFTDPDDFRQSDTCFVDQLCGQWQAWLLGLGELGPASSALVALRSIGALNVPGTTYGAVSGVNAEGSVDASGGSQSSSVAPAEVWNFAGAAMMAGQKFNSGDLKRIGLLAAERAYNAIVDSGTIWNQYCLYASKDAKQLSGPCHTGNLSIWALPFAYEGVPLRPNALPQ